MSKFPWAVITPMANEESSFHEFTASLKKQLDEIGNGKVFMVIDRASTDSTPELCRQLSASDPRFVTVWAPENKNVVDAYLRGYKEALKSDAKFILEIDSGMSHDPAALPQFLRRLYEGYECVYGSRFMKGGSMEESPGNRLFLSKGGTVLSNLMLGTSLKDMTSGYQGFTREIVQKFCSFPLRSKAHFYQTELKYLLRKFKTIEIPIHYRAPSPRVSQRAIQNSIACLFFYFVRRITFRAVSIS